MTLRTRVQVRRDTTANWLSANPTLAEGEIGIQTDGQKLLKLGDGVTAWNSLTSGVAASGLYPLLAGETGVTDSRYAWGNVKRYGGAVDGVTNDAAAFDLAVTNAAVLHVPVIIDGWCFVNAISAITANDVTIQGVAAGSGGSRLLLGGGVGVVVNATAVTGARFTMRNLELRLAAALAAYMLDVQASDGVCLDNVRFHNGGAAYAVNTTKALRIGEVNNSTIINPAVIGSGTDLFAVGLDLCQGVTGNRGNVSVLGGLVNRATIGTRIAQGASNLVNNIALIGLKHKTTWASGSVGVDIYSSTKIVEMLGVQCESYETSVRAAGATGLALLGCYLSLFDTGTGAAFTTICDGIWIDGRTRFANNSSAGIGISFDASAHTSINIDSPSLSNCATNISNLSTSSSGWRIFSLAGSTNFGGTRAAGFDFGGPITAEGLLIVAGGAATVAIAAGVLAAPTASNLIVTAESGASDDLDTITSPGTGYGGTLLILRAATGKAITLTQAGNLKVSAPRLLDSTSDRWTGIWDGSSWIELAYANNA